MISKNSYQPAHAVSTIPSVSAVLQMLPELLCLMGKSIQRSFQSICPKEPSAKNTEGHVWWPPPRISAARRLRQNWEIQTRPGCLQSIISKVVSGACLVFVGWKICPKDATNLGVCACVHACVCVHVTVWKPEIDVGCLPPLFITSVCERGLSPNQQLSVCFS